MDRTSDFRAAGASAAGMGAVSDTDVGVHTLTPRPPSRRGPVAVLPCAMPSAERRRGPRQGRPKSGYGNRPDWVRDPERGGEG